MRGLRASCGLQALAVCYPAMCGERPQVAALFATAEGLAVFDPAMVGPALPPTRGQPGPPVEPLTPRELDVLQLLADGLVNRAIAQRLGISERSAKAHVTGIPGKLGTQSRAEAVARGIRLGLLPL